MQEVHNSLKGEAYTAEHLSMLRLKSVLCIKPGRPRGQPDASPPAADGVRSKQPSNSPPAASAAPSAANARRPSSSPHSDKAKKRRKT